MSLFQIPPSTRFDLNFPIFGIPVRVHPLFWVMGLLLGSRAGSITQILLWIVVIFISILIHELGHSFMMKAYGQDSYIVLHMAGGLAVPTSRRGGRWSNGAADSTQQILISLAGPFAGFLLAVIVLVVVATLGAVISINWFLGFIPLPVAFLPNSSWIVNVVVEMLLWVNIFWSLINLMPTFPLDGGNVARSIFVQVDPWNGIRKSLWLSVISGATVAIVGLVYLSSVFMALLFGFLAFQSYQMLQGFGGRMY